MSEVIVVGSVKGGTGKSCTAQNMAVCLAMRGHNVALVDLDPQKTTEEWFVERRAHLNLVKISGYIPTGSAEDLIKSIRPLYDFIICDAGGYDGAYQREAIINADRFLLVLRPKRRDLKALPMIDEVLGRGMQYNPDLKINTLINQCNPLPTQVKRILDAKYVCESYDFSPLQTVVMHRNVFDDSEENGRGVLEMPNDCRDLKAEAEVNDLVDELIFGIRPSDKGKVA